MYDNKPKSMKLRLLVTLHALFKHSDARHRMNSKKLNTFLRPYGLDCTSRVLSDTVRVMQEYGLDVRYKGEWDSQGVWIENRPLPDHELNRLIFAVTTNPHISKEQATEILQSLKPFVTVYQEPLLEGFVEGVAAPETDDSLYWTYSVIHEAISAGRRVRYSVDYIKYHSESKSVEKKQEWATLFTPKCVYQTKGQLYMVGFNNTDQRIDAVNLRDIASIKLAFKHKDPHADQVNGWISGIEPQEHIPGEFHHIVYEGPVTFQCRGQYIGELYNRFGPPDGPVEKDARSRTTYIIQDAAITSDDLHWLCHIPEHGIRIAGPEPFRKTVEDYFTEELSSLMEGLPSNKPKH